jgi:hypothetical protein
MSVTSITELEANLMSTGLYYMQAVLPCWRKGFLFSKSPRMGLEPIQLPIQLVPRLLPEGKVAGASC